MLTDSKAYSGFAVKDVARAKEFYGQTLGLKVDDVPDMGPLLSLHLGSGADVLVYESPNATPPSYTILNFPVTDLEGAMSDLESRGVTFERYDGFEQDERGVMRGEGQAIAWFKDPDGNTLSVMSEE